MSILQLQLQTFKPLIGVSVSDTSKDASLTFILMNVEETILNHCNISKIPSGLQNTAYMMCMEVYKLSAVTSEDGEDSEKEISSISEGDTSISFEQSVKHKMLVNKVLDSYLSKLNRFRRLEW